jgi:HEAT repeats
LPQQTKATHKFLLKGLHDPAEGVRWQAALAIATAKWNDAQSTSALLESLNDTNEFVGAAAVHALARLGATNAAPALSAKLKLRLQTAVSAPEEFERQASAVMRDAGSNFQRGGQYELLDPEHLEMSIGFRVPEQAKRMATMRLPPQPFALPTHDYTLVDALIEALGDLEYTPEADELFKLRGTDYDGVAVRALNKIARERLGNEILATAKDTKTDSFFRERELVTLCNLSMTNRVRDLVPLLDDVTPIVYSRSMPGQEWRICDRAAVSIAILLGWEQPIMMRYLRPGQREELMKRAREWTKSAP